jgi:hypothetical protein
MNQPPQDIDGAQVVRWTPIDERHTRTEKCEHIINGNAVHSVFGLAICRYPNQTGYYLFGCDYDWAAVTDTFHDMIEDALRQAEFEYRGVTETWKIV